ncbi:MAG: hypothetical protein HKL83_00925 [Acidimicrobiaceae bacterium]|nr:hypothetical protein [Acidimicrobiaceae bacterium]
MRILGHVDDSLGTAKLTIIGATNKSLRPDLHIQGNDQGAGLNVTMASNLPATESVLARIKAQLPMR